MFVITKMEAGENVILLNRIILFIFLLSKAQWYYRVSTGEFWLWQSKCEFCTFILEVSLPSPYLVLQAGRNRGCRPLTNIFEPGLVLLHLLLQRENVKYEAQCNHELPTFTFTLHRQSIHVNITFVGTLVISFIMFNARSIAVLSSTCFSTLSLWLFLDTYWSFSCIFIKQNMFWFSLKCKKKN